MNQERKQELQRLAELSTEEIGDNENNVKYKFIIPFLESFGYSKKLDFEHAAQGNRIDILIDTNSGHKILIEAKSYGKNLDDYIPQVRRYCDEKRPILAIITNGEELRFYSPLWKKPDFTETLIYSISRHQLSDVAIIEKIESILCREFLENEKIDENIIEREKEINIIKKDIQSHDSLFQEEIAKHEALISNLEEQIKSFSSQIDAKKREVTNLRQEKNLTIQNLKKKYHIYISQPTREQYKNPIRSTEPKQTMHKDNKYDSKKPLGRKGNDQLSDYVIPVIHLIRSGVKHTEAFHQIAKKLDVAYQTVNDRCARGLGISTEEFVDLIESNEIKSFLKEKFPDKAQFIEQEL